MATSTTPGRNAQGVINAPNPAAGINEIDIQIVSTLVSDLPIELFNPESSQFKVVNNAINNYVPVAPFSMEYADAAGADISIALDGATANQYLGGVIVGSQDIFVNAAGFVPLGSTNNVCFFDRLGNAVYQPGYVNGVKTAGNVTITATQQNVTYRHLMEWGLSRTWDFHSAKISYSEIGQQVNPLLFVKTDIFGQTGKVQINPINAKSEDQFNALLLTPSVKQRMYPNVGMQYKMSAYTTGNSQVVAMNIFMSVIDNRVKGANGAQGYAANAD